MVTLSWVDLYYLSQEFNSQLQGAKIENWYGNHEELYIKLYKSGRKNLFLSTFLSKGLILINSEKYQHNSKNIFIQYLRKILKGATLEQIYSHYKERVISLELSTKNRETQEVELYYVHIELFMGGQIIICNSKQEILRTLKTTQHTNTNTNQEQQQDDETAKPQNKYALQVSHAQNSQIQSLFQQSLQTINTEFTQLSSIDESSEKKHKLSIQDYLKPLGIGKTYINYVALCLNVNSTTPLEHSKLTTLSSKLEQLLKHSINPCSISSNQHNSTHLLLPFHPEIINNDSVSLTPLNTTFSQAIITTHHKDFIPQNSVKEPAKLTKLKKRLSQQQSHLKKIKEQSQHLEQQAGAIYENYTTLQELQTKINSIVEEKGFQELKRLTKENMLLKELIVSINEKDKIVTINVEKLQELQSSQ
ncbi:MAG: NFACT family protein [Candidatus Nanoarchaeia archaeon]